VPFDATGTQGGVLTPRLVKSCSPGPIAKTLISAQGNTNIQVTRLSAIEAETEAGFPTPRTPSPKQLAGAGV